MINVKDILKDYDKSNITIGVLGGHSALDVCHGAKKLGFRTLCIVRRDRQRTYAKYYKNIIDEVILVDKFSDVINDDIQKRLRDMNTIFIHNRYFWVYFDFKDVEQKFNVPIYGTRTMLKLEERDVEHNQYYLMEKSGIRFPRLYTDPKKIDRLVIVKVNEAKRGYERAFFFASSYDDFNKKSDELIKSDKITKKALESAIIEEYIVGAHVNLNYFNSVIDGKIELMGTDTRRQTNLDGVLRLPATEQIEALKHISPTMIETGHYAVTVKESLLEKIFELGEKFVEGAKKVHPPGIIGPFALQGAVASENGKEEFIIFDLSLRIPGSPGTPFTPYTMYNYGESISYGQRIAMEIKKAIEQDKLDIILT